MLKSNATKNIIIIDDDINILNSLKFVFRSSGFSIKYFNNPLIALEEILKNDYSIIITDIEMPEMSGIDMILQLQKKKEIKKVVFMSSNIEKYIKIIIKLNALFIKKPIKKDILFNVIDHIKK